MSWVDFEDFERAKEWINEPPPHQVEDGSCCDDEPGDEYYGSPCLPKCEMCRRALDECNCFEGGAV
ncbi:hypothetical protein D3875_03015 [Deinococcus cavernae]|uniref:Uncharacterized protein n=1 Tax=Deinococcus cavernae TaxID=2320857 RepID=A0A418VFV2_9DEIO|nr:hypothetical protein [Deinococcus cavernae]RJF74983.1 hypothetical protein D3875_03015 [Deinococcus cavernae]